MSVLFWGKENKFQFIDPFSYSFGYFKDFVKLEKNSLPFFFLVLQKELVDLVLFKFDFVLIKFFDRLFIGDCIFLLRKKMLEEHHGWLCGVVDIRPVNRYTKNVTQLFNTISNLL